MGGNRHKATQGRPSYSRRIYLFKWNHLSLPRTSLRDKVIKDLHAVGHIGRDKTIIPVEER